MVVNVSVVTGHAYQETDEPEVWIECSMCEQWFHAKLTCLPQPEDKYICLKCQ